MRNNHNLQSRSKKIRIFSLVLILGALGAALFTFKDQQKVEKIVAVNKKIDIEQKPNKASSQKTREAAFLEKNTSNKKDTGTQRIISKEAVVSEDLKKPLNGDEEVSLLYEEIEFDGQFSSLPKIEYPKFSDFNQSQKFSRNEVVERAIDPESFPNNSDIKFPEKQYPIPNQYMVIVENKDAAKNLEAFENVKDLGNNTYLVNTENLEQLEKTEGITSVENDGWVYLSSEQPIIPNDPYFHHQWALHNTGYQNSKPDADMDVVEAWNVRTDIDIVIAVADTGINHNLNDIKTNLFYNQLELNGQPGVDDDKNGFIDDSLGWDFLNGDRDAMDDHSHGTACATIMAAQGNNQYQMSGICINAKIMPLKVLGANGWGSWSALAQAINYAVDNGVKVISCSLGGRGGSAALYASIQRANEHGVLVICAAGNDSSNNDTYQHFPSNYDLPNVISVLSSDFNDRRSSFSNYGVSSVDIAAPGSSILCVTRTNSLQLWNGTSMATPFVAGAAGLYMSENPNATHLEVKEAILETVDTSDHFKSLCVSGGRLNLDRLLRHNQRVEFPTPSGLKAQVGRIGDEQLAVEISWNKLEMVDYTIDHYKILRSATAEGDFVQIATAESTDKPRVNHIDPLESNKQHNLFYKVVAVFTPGNIDSLASEALPVSISTIPPQLKITANNHRGEVPFIVDFTIEATDEAPGEVVRFEFDFDGDGVTDHVCAPTKTLSHTFTTPGTFNAKLTVFDDVGLTASKVINLQTFGTRTGMPVAKFQPTQDSGFAPLHVYFEDKSTQGDSKIVAYEYDFDGDGIIDYSSPHNGNMVHEFKKAGIQNVKLRITDNKARSSTFVYPISVREPDELPEILRATAKLKNDRYSRFRLRFPADVIFTFESKNKHVPVKKWLLDRNNDGSFDQEISATQGSSITHFVSQIDQAGHHTMQVVAVDDQGLQSHPHTFSFLIDNIRTFFTFLVQPQNHQEIHEDMVMVQALTTHRYYTKSVSFQYKTEVDQDWITFETVTQPKAVGSYWSRRLYEAQLPLMSFSDNTNIQIRTLATPRFSFHKSASSQIVTITKTSEKNEEQEEFRTIEEIEFENPKGTILTIPFGAYYQDPITIEIDHDANIFHPHQGSVQEQDLLSAENTLSVLVKHQGYDLGHPAKPLILKTPYADENNDGIVDGTNISENEISLHFFDTHSQQWFTSVRNTIDTENNLITAHVLQLGDMGVFGKGAVTNKAPEITFAYNYVMRSWMGWYYNRYPLDVRFYFRGHDSDGRIVEYLIDYDNDGVHDATVPTRYRNIGFHTARIGHPGIKKMSVVAVDDKGARSKPREFSVVVESPRTFMVHVRRPFDHQTVYGDRLLVDVLTTQLHNTKSISIQLMGQNDSEWKTVLTTDRNMKYGRRSIRMYRAYIDISDQVAGSDIKVRVLGINKTGDHTEENPFISQVVTFKKANFFR